MRQILTLIPDEQRNDDNMMLEFGVTKERANELRDLAEKLTSDSTSTANIIIPMWNDQSVTDMELLYLAHQLGQATALHRREEKLRKAIEYALDKEVL